MYRRGLGKHERRCNRNVRRSAFFRDLTGSGDHDLGVKKYQIELLVEWPIQFIVVWS